MNQLTPYEQSLADQLSDLPVPGEDRAWQEMKKLLEKDDDDGMIVPPPQRRGCALPAILLLFIISACIYFYISKVWFSSNNDREMPVPEATAKSDSVSSKPPADSLTSGKSIDAINTVTDNSKAGVINNSDPSQMHPPTSSAVIIPGGIKQTETVPQKIRTSGKSKINIRPGVASEGDSSAAGYTNVITGEPYTTNSRGNRNERSRFSVSNNTSQKESTASVTNRNKMPKPGPRKKLESTEKSKSNIGITVVVTENLAAGDEVTELQPLPDKIDSMLVETSVPQTFPDPKEKDSSNTEVKMSAPIDTVAPALKKMRFHFGVGIAVNQGIPVNGQKVVAVDNFGRESSLTDYVPSIYIRLYKEKKWFIQSEFRYGAPQYIQEFVYRQNIKQDTGQSPIFTTSYKLKKTYYHQLPLSFNYLILSGWSMGTGIIYNKFTGAISEEEIRRRLPGAVNDSLLSFSVVNDKKDSSFVKNSFQWLLETQYKWKRFSIGARYARGLQAYIKYTDPLSNIPVSKKNTSLHVFIRYEIWNSKKRMVGYRDPAKTKVVSRQ